MKQEFNNIDELFRAELNDYSPAVPEDAWENIALSLAQPARKKAGFFVFHNWKIAASVALLISGGGLATYIFLNKPAAVNTIAETPVVNESQRFENESAAQNNTILQNQGPISGKAETGNKTTTFASVEKPAIENNSSGITAPTIDNNPDNTGTANSEPSLLNELVTENEKDPNVASINTDNPSQQLVQEIKEPQPETQAENYTWNTITENQTDRSGKWIVGGQAGPQYSYRTLSSDYYSSSMIDQNNNSESGVVAFAGGVQVEYKTSKRFSIQSGIIYSKMGVEQIASSTERYPVNNPSASPTEGETASIDNASNYVFPNSAVRIGPKNNNSLSRSDALGNYTNYFDQMPENTMEEIPSWRNYEYIEVPVMARYAVIDRKINLQILGGFSTNILINNSISVQTPDNTTNLETQYVNTINYSSTLGIGLSYDITGQLIMSVEPQFKYFLNNQIYNSNVDLHPYSLGVFTGVKYLF